MAWFCSRLTISLVLFVLILGSADAPLFNSYSSSCPQLLSIVQSTVRSAVIKEPQMGASLLRLFFHDCFVKVCDDSILTDDTSSFTGDFARGFEVIDDIKSEVEKVCPGIVSCADILALAAGDSVLPLGGPAWDVKLGRRDTTTASQSASNNGIPRTTSELNQLISRFSSLGLSTKDLVALSGAHTIGQARCTSFRQSLYSETSINTSFASTKQSSCPRASGSGDNKLAPLDHQTLTSFDNKYFKNLVQKKGLCHSDHQPLNGGSTDSRVRVTNPGSFCSDFVSAMIKMGDISPLNFSNGEIRKNCRRVN